MPLSISLAVSGLAVQLYASYNLVTASNGARLRIPFMSKLILELFYHFESFYLDEIKISLIDYFL